MTFTDNAAPLIVRAAVVLDAHALPGALVLALVLAAAAIHHRRPERKP